MLGDEEAAVTGNSHMRSGVGVVDTVQQEPPPKKSEEHAEDHKKEKSVLQAKLTKLAIQIGYAGTIFI